MRKIKDIISKPSEALQAMHDGLIEQSQREDFIIDMSTFGEYNTSQKLCFGCAATCALQKIMDTNISPENILTTNTRAQFLKLDINDLDSFEATMDAARTGFLSSLFAYFSVDSFTTWHIRTMANFNLQNDNWKEQLPILQAYIEVLKEAGY